MDNIDSRLQSVLEQFDGIRLALLFGSRANETARPDSDIDIALLFDAPLSGELKIRITEAIAIEFGTTVDVVDLYHCAEPITGQALQGRRILGSTEVFARLLSRHLIEAADFLPLQRRILEERQANWIR